MEHKRWKWPEVEEIPVQYPVARSTLHTISNCFWWMAHGESLVGSGNGSGDVTHWTLHGRDGVMMQTFEKNPCGFFPKFHAHTL